jgi:hypothetical protein
MSFMRAFFGFLIRQAETGSSNSRAPAVWLSATPLAPVFFRLQPLDIRHAFR